MVNEGRSSGQDNASREGVGELTLSPPNLGYDEDDAFISACKGTPYTPTEWRREVLRLQRDLDEARERFAFARAHGACLHWRFGDIPYHLSSARTSAEAPSTDCPPSQPKDVT